MKLYLSGHGSNSLGSVSTIRYEQGGDETVPKHWGREVGMVSGRGNRRSRKRQRWAALLVALMIAIVIGAVAASRLRSSPKAPQRLDLLYAAWNEFNAKSYDRATAILDRRAAEHEPTPLDWMLRARISESQGRLIEALGHLKHISDEAPISSQAWLKAGQIELVRHNARGAEAAFRHSLVLNPDQIQSYRELAYLYAVQVRREECDAQYLALSRRIPFDYVLAFAWCQNYCRLWDPNEARKVLTGFVEFDHDDRVSRLALATNLRLANLLDQAEAALGPLPDSDPEARSLRAEVAIDKGEIDAAQVLVRDGPADHVRLNVIRGRLALTTKNAATAADYFRAALRQDLEDHDAIAGLGRALRLMGDPQAREFTEAALRYESFRRALQESSTTRHTDRKLFYKLGEHCESVHRPAAARTWYNLAVILDPLDAAARQALDRLDHAVPTSATAPVLNEKAI
jgi:predicted Zn-dependent protease